MSAVISIFSCDSFLGEARAKSVWTPKVVAATIIMLVSGTMNTLSFKLQNKQPDFKHGMLQSSLTFIGEYAAMLVFALSICCSKGRKECLRETAENAKENNKNPQPSLFWPLIPALFDTFGSSLQIVALLLIPASINQMLRGGVIIFTCLFSKIFLGRVVHKHHLLGIGFCMIGFAIVGTVAILIPTNIPDADTINLSDSQGNQILTGIIMLIISICIQAGQFVAEENIILKNEISPMRMVGIEGMFGIIFIFILISISSFIPCPTKGMCNMMNNAEDPELGLILIFRNWKLMFWCMVTIISIMLFNLNGLILTKSVSSVFRAFWDATRTILVWFFSLVFGLERFIFKAFIIQIFGFVFLILGNFIYNEILEVPFMGFNKKLRKYLPPKISRRRKINPRIRNSQITNSFGYSSKQFSTYKDSTEHALTKERYDDRPEFLTEL